MCCGFGSICGGSGGGVWWVVASWEDSGGSVWADFGVFVPSRCFCSDPRFPSVLVVWSLGVLGFCMALEVLVLLGDVLGLVWDESHEGVLPGFVVLGLCIRVAIGCQVASVSHRGYFLLFSY